MKAKSKAKADKRLRLEWIEAGTLAANPRNWRKHPDGQVKALKNVLADPQIGWAGACLYNERTKRLIDGHARRNAVDPSTPIPVLIGSWSEEAEKKILLTLDPLAGMAIPDVEQLRTLLDDVTLDADLSGISDNLEAMLDAAEAEERAGMTVEEDEAPAESEVEPRCHAGDLWLLGEHRLLCGDSTKAEDVARVMGGDKAGLCFTSPPYGLQRDYTAEAKAKLDDWDGWNALMHGVFSNLPMADDGQVLVNLGLIHRNGEWLPYWDGWIEWMRQQGWRRFAWYVWDQGFGLPGDWNGRLAPSHEFVFHFNRAPIQPSKCVRKKPENIKARNVGSSTMRGKDGECVKFTSPESSAQPNKIGDSVIRINRMHGGHGIDHPAVFPVEFPAFVLQSWCGIVYDPFLGSGTTLIAAEQLGRRAYGLEISPKYCDIILARWEKLTGEKSERA